MAVQLELERTFLAKYIPAQIDGARSALIHDIYIPEPADHATLRLRQTGNAFEITKKVPVSGNDSSQQNEHTISLSEAEYTALAVISKKSLTKQRYYCTVFGQSAEVDIYQDSMEGLVTVDFEFSSPEEMNAFTPPEFCLVEVTQDEVSAAGKLAGKTYADIQPRLEYYGYQPLFLDKEEQSS